MNNTDKCLPLFLAPMAGAGDRAFREICAKYGADEFFSEMISAKAVSFNDKKSFELAECGDAAVPCRIQIFGHEEKILSESAKTLYERFSPCGFDMNMGCPVPKIVKNHDGSYMLKNPDECGRALFAVKNSVDVPVSAKIRLGWDNSSVNAIEVAKALENAGADRITVHCRTREDMYQSGTAKPYEIAKVKEAVSVPVIANGDVRDFESYKIMESLGADGVMIGRAAIGRPWIFAEIKAASMGIEYKADKKEIIKEHLFLAKKYKPEMYIFEMRMHMAHYLKGFRGASKLRNAVSMASSLEDYLEIIEQL